MLPTEYLDQIRNLLDKIEITGIDRACFTYDTGIEIIMEMLFRCKQGQKTLYLCGNGGSAGIAQHMTADFLRNGGLRTHSLYEQAALTCISNDFSYEQVFSRQLDILAEPEELLIAVSSSGNSANIINAAEIMRSKGGKIITFTGFTSHNKLRQMGEKRPE